MPPPPPPPPPPPAAGGGGGDGITALFAELNKGTDVTKGLKHVKKGVGLDRVRKHET